MNIREHDIHSSDDSFIRSHSAREWKHFRSWKRKPKPLTECARTAALTFDTKNSQSKEDNSNDNKLISIRNRDAACNG